MNIQIAKGTSQQDINYMECYIPQILTLPPLFLVSLILGSVAALLTYCSPPAHPRPTHPLTSLTHLEPEPAPAETCSFLTSDNFWQGIGPLILRSACRQPETMTRRRAAGSGPHV